MHTLCLSGNPQLALLDEHAWVHTVKQLDIDLAAAARNAGVLTTMVGAGVRPGWVLQRIP